MELAEEEPATGPDELQRWALELCQSAEQLIDEGDIEGALSALDRAYELMLQLPDNGDDSYLQAKEDIRLLVADLITRHYRAGRVAAARPTTSWDLELPMVDNEYVRREIESFTGKERDQFIAGYRRAGPLPADDPRQAGGGGAPEPAQLAADGGELVQGAGLLAGERGGHVAVHLLHRAALRPQPRRLGGRAFRPREVHRRGDRLPHRPARDVRGLAQGPRRLQLRRGAGGAPAAALEDRVPGLLGPLRGASPGRRAATCPGSSPPSRSSRTPRSTG